MTDDGYDAVVVAGGAGRRLGGADKPALTVGGRTLLDRVLAACADARQTLVVGPGRPTERTGLRWLREDPPGGGPLAAVAAALPAVTAPRVLLLAADLPFLDAATVRRLLAALDEAGSRDDGDGGWDGALLVDADGRDQPLAAAYRTAPLRAARTALGDPAGRPLRGLLAPLRLTRLPDPAGAAFDCDTWDELAAARDRAERG
ncbi:molybdenum cofactor guanylyltransferase [Kitasatospora cineracea]|uniref:molybdenum cofactor guanylyltransferase n=1 Tax=Kitasatospora cineracea TaxID=88074 RepID=UPI00380EF7BE